MADDTTRPRAIYGTGGLFQTRLRGELVWCSQKSVMLDGRRRYARGYGRTPVEATQRRDANYERYLKYGTARAPRMTLSRAVDAWAKDKDAEKSAEYRTQMTHSIHRHWIARIGDARLADITKTKAIKAHDDIAATRGVAAGRNARKHLKTLMNYALRQGWITVNPLAGWAGTKYKAAVAQTDEAMADLRVREFAAFVKWLRDGNDDFYYVAVALSLGLRPGEVCGLELDSLRPLHAPKGEDKPLGLVIDREYSQSAHRIVPWVKTSGSVRTLKLTAGQAAIFGEWMLIRQNLSIPEDWARNQLFPHCWTRRGGAWHGRNRNALWMEWGKKLHDFIMDFAATSEMTVSEERYRSYYYFRPHFNRHLAATRMADARVPIRTAMATLGHLTESMTEHYTHIMDDSKSAAMDALDAALTQKSTLM